MNCEIKQLLEYGGSSPCPDDFDEFWDKRLEELKSHKVQFELKENAFKSSVAECFDLFFYGTKGAKIYAKYLRPRNAENAPLIFCFHGYGGSSSEWTDYLKFVSEGYCVAALDCRGQAGYSEDVGNKYGPTYQGLFTRGIEGRAEDMTFVQQYLDLALLAKITMSFPEVNEKRVVASGISQGGGLSFVCAALVPEIKLVIAWYPFLSDFKKVWDMGDATGAYEEMRFYVRAHDPRFERESEFFEKLGYIDIQNFAKRISADVIMSTGLMDNCVPPITQFAAFNKVKSNKKYILYPYFGHEILNGQNDADFEYLIKFKSDESVIDD